MTDRLRLGVNIDHVATIRNARGGDHPDPVRGRALLPVITEHKLDQRYVIERHLCIDTTAAGGNASLIASAE